MPTLTNIFSTYSHTNDNEEENDIFFFHSDHLGSTSYLTDKEGNACEYVCYMPYGESIVDENNTDFENLFKFTGKELDRETGQYYFEQRYYNPFDARFTTIDSHYEKYPSLSPWNYCNSNPMKFIDPTGESWFQNKETGEVAWIKGCDDEVYANDFLGNGYMESGAGKWTVMGDDNMFGKSPYDLLEGSQRGLAEDHFSWDMLGNNSEAFMQNQGYEFMPTKMLEMETTSSTIPTQYGDRWVSTSNTTINQLIIEGKCYQNKNLVSESTRSVIKMEYSTIFTPKTIWDVNVDYHQKNSKDKVMNVLNILGNFVRMGTNPN
ncbi:MAG: RHS repeat-associated core domain-containing protein [Bacteroidales bacterium]|nr:RHS repeat-associated core domain-containing protein [Bacteroidales bacterium]